MLSFQGRGNVHVAALKTAMSMCQQDHYTREAGRCGAEQESSDKRHGGDFMFKTKLKTSPTQDDWYHPD